VRAVRLALSIALSISAQALSSPGQTIQRRRQLAIPYRSTCQHRTSTGPVPGARESRTGSRRSTTGSKRHSTRTRTNCTVMNDSLREPVSGCVAVSMVLCRTESLRTQQHHQRPEPAAALLPRQLIRFLVPGLQRRWPPRIPPRGNNRATLRAQPAVRSFIACATAPPCESTCRDRWLARGAEHRSRARLVVRRTGAGRLRAWATTGRSTRSRSGIPRLAVYDDVHGWNHEPYIGAGEFLSRSTATSMSRSPCRPRTGLPPTGDLVNSLQVLTAKQVSRLALCQAVGHRDRHCHAR